ncbi:MAG: hypothetical protein V7746_01620 [Halioglobus sp.]
MKRRDLMLGMGLAAAAAPLLGQTSENNDAMVPGADDETELLFVQNARAASLADGLLKLTGISDSTIYFSDRPEHLVGHWQTEDFVGNWGTGDDNSFAASPPNAELSIMSAGEAENIVVALKNPRLVGGDLLYDVDVLEGAKTANGDSVALFIDTLGRPLSPVSVAGVHRRHRRRRRAIMR